MGDSRRHLCSGRWREFDVEREKGAEAANAIIGPDGVQGKAGNVQQAIAIIDIILLAGLSTQLPAESPE